MNKLHSLAFYTLVTPMITLGAGSAFAGNSAEEKYNHEQQSTQRDQGAMQNNSKTQKDDQNTFRAQQSDPKTAAEHLKMREKSNEHSQGYMEFTPTNGLHASNLIGAEVKTSSDENVGSVNDLIIDEDGHVAAIVVGVGGFLGMGERNVAINWNHVTQSGDSDELELQIDATGDDLRSAPEFKLDE